jgi:hypothetical protein
MSEVEKARGNMELADSLCDKARAVVEDIAVHAGEMRNVFLKQPAIVQILGETYSP